MPSHFPKYVEADKKREESGKLGTTYYLKTVTKKSERNNQYIEMALQNIDITARETEGDNLLALEEALANLQKNLPAIDLLEYAEHEAGRELFLVP